MRASPPSPMTDTRALDEPLSDAELEERIYRYSEDASAILPEPQTDERFAQLQVNERHRVVSHANATRGKA